jgi:hypothetical protein
MHASIICACLPYCRHFLISFGANFLKSTRTDDSVPGYGSRTGGTKRTSERVTLSVGKSADGAETPKRGDEGDFVPLVEYRNKNWDNKTTVSAAHTAGSTDSL